MPHDDGMTVAFLVVAGLLIAWNILIVGAWMGWWVWRERVDHSLTTLDDLVNVSIDGRVEFVANTNCDIQRLTKALESEAKRIDKLYQWSQELVVKLQVEEDAT